MKTDQKKYIITERKLAKILSLFLEECEHNLLHRIGTSIEGKVREWMKEKDLMQSITPVDTNTVGDVTDWKTKVEFYRTETERLRRYIFDNSIGMPCQSIFQAAIDEIERLKHQPIAVSDVEKAAEKFATETCKLRPSGKFFKNPTYEWVKIGFKAGAEWQAKQSTPIEDGKINRVEVIDDKGRSYVNWDDKNKVELSYQDEGKTLKIFITNEK